MKKHLSLQMPLYDRYEHITRDRTNKVEFLATFRLKWSLMKFAKILQQFEAEAFSSCEPSAGHPFLDYKVIVWVSLTYTILESRGGLELFLEKR